MNLFIPDVFFTDEELLETTAGRVAYGIRPFGLGRLTCESLHSYLLRLSMAHRVGPYDLLQYLVEKFAGGNSILSVLQQRRFMTDRFIFQTGNSAKTVARILAEATGEQSLEQCTLLPLANTISIWNLTRDHRVYCPICVANSKMRQQREMLISTIKCVKACPIHGAVLLKVGCGDRTNTGPYALRPLLPGVCPDCGSIGHRCRWTERERAKPLDVWVSKQVGMLIASFGLPDHFSRDNMIEALSDVAKQRYGGKVAWLARAAGIPKTTFHLWMHGKSIPNIEQLLAVCYAAEISLVKLVCGEVKYFKSPREQFRARRVKRGSLKSKLDRVEATINSELRSYPTKSLAKVAHAFGVDPKTVRHHLPDLVHRLVKQAQTHRKRELSNRQSALKRSVHVAGKKLLKRGDGLSRRNFERQLRCNSYSGSTIDSEIQRFQAKFAE